MGYSFYEGIHTFLAESHGHATGLHVTRAGSACPALRVPAASLSALTGFITSGFTTHEGVRTSLLNTLHTFLTQKLTHGNNNNKVETSRIHPGA